MADKASELKLRVISAVILAVLAFIEVWAGGWLFAVFVSAMALIVFLEWTAIIGLSAFERERIMAVACMVMPLVMLIFLGTASATFTLVLCAGLVFFLTRSTTAETCNWITLAVVYCGLSAIALVGIRNHDEGIALILLLFAIVWGTDIGAYFVGRKLGGPKLAPRISPGKTQSGAIGGVIIAAVCALAIAGATGVVSVTGAIIIAFIVSCVSQAGDLFESYLKRRFNVKDSGVIIPGHGGLFDRVDGLMAASIVFFVILLFT